MIDGQYPELKLHQLRLQLACLTHRLDHYHYIQFYINDFQAAGRQLRTAATGGSNTTDFLPDLIDSNMAQARGLVSYFKGPENSTHIKHGQAEFLLLSEIEEKLDEFARGKANIKGNSQAIEETERE